MHIKNNVFTGTCRDTKRDSIGTTSEPKQLKFWNAGNSQVCQSQIFNYTVKEWIILTYYKNDLNIEDCYWEIILTTKQNLQKKTHCDQETGSNFGSRVKPSKRDSYLRDRVTSKKWATASSGVPTSTPWPRFRMWPVGPAAFTTLPRGKQKKKRSKKTLFIDRNIALAVNFTNFTIVNELQFEMCHPRLLFCPS